MILLDTTVLVYARGAPHPLRERCRAVLDAHASGRIEATTTVEVIQEFVHAYGRRRSRPVAVLAARQLAVAFELVQTLPTDLDRAFDLYLRHAGLGAFDAVLAAVALERQAEALVSADRAFGGIDGLRWIDPAGRKLDALLAG